MRNQKAALRYAKSLIGLAKEKGQLEAVHQDAELVTKTIEDSRDLELLLNTPIVKEDKKQAVLASVFGGKVSDITQSFISLMTSKKRETLLESTFQKVIDLYRHEKGIVSAVLKSAVELDEKTKQAIREKIQSDNKTIELEEVVDPELIGGFILRVGDNQVDASVSSKLRKLKQELTH